MEAIFPISALSKNTAEVRAAAQNDIVRITENGRGAYVFCSEAAFEARVAREVEDAIAERELIAMLDLAIEQIDSGQGIPAEEARKQIAEARAARQRQAA